MSERPLVMVFHGVLIGLVVAAIFQFLKASKSKTEAVSVLVGSLATAQMVAFGHGMPTHLNPVLRL